MEAGVQNVASTVSVSDQAKRVVPAGGKRTALSLQLVGKNNIDHFCHGSSMFCSQHKAFLPEV